MGRGLLLAGVLACFPCPGIARAGEDTPDVLYVTGQVTTIESAGVGGGGGIEWLHPLSTESALNVGGFAFSLGGSQWAYGKVGGFVTYRGSTTVSGQISLGGGQRTEQEFTYQIYQIEVTQALIAKRLYLAAEDQYSDVDITRENVVKAGIILYPTPSLGMRLNYHVSTGGNVDSRFVSGRVDLLTKPVGLLAGFLVGRTTPERLNVITATRGTPQTEEFYAGVSIPLGRHEVSVILDVARQPSPGVDKVTTLLVWKIPF